MSNNLVIVESPAKAATIEKILGKDFKVVSSYGHIRDLEKKNMGVDIANSFTPRYYVSDDKKTVLKSLIKESKNSDIIWLACIRNVFFAENYRPVYRQVIGKFTGVVPPLQVPQ